MVTAVDAVPSRVQYIAGAYPYVRIAADYDAVLADRTIDAVVIATPTRSHIELARKALKAGKHVLCENPLCTTVAEARELVDLSERQEVVLMTGHVFLFNPGIIKIKELASEGQLGDILYISAVRTNLGPIRGDVNAAFDLAAHDVSVINWLLDAEPCRVSASGGAFLQPGIHDVVFINLTFPDGQVASIHASWLNPKKVRQMTVVGDNRMATWDDLSMTTPVAVFDRGANAVPDSDDFGESLRISMWDGDVRMPKVEATEPLKLQCRHFLQGIRDGIQVQSNGMFSLGVVRVLEAVQQSLDSNGSPVTLG